MISTSSEKRRLNFELALHDELVREFGAGNGVFILDHLKMIENFSVSSEISGMRITFESLPFLGESCLLEALGGLFRTNGDCERVFAAFKKAKEAHLESGGKQAADWHGCSLAFRGGCGGETMECLAKKLMAKGRTPLAKKQPSDVFLARNGIKKA